MSDPRTTPANARVAAAHLADAPAALVRVAGEARQIALPVVDLLDTPGGSRARQLLLGEGVTVFEDRDGWNFVQADKDGYVGYVPGDALGPRRAATHWVSAPATHVYEAPDIRSRNLMALGFGARITVLSDNAAFVQTPHGFVPRVRLLPLGQFFSDPVKVAASLLGTPYLWGGNSCWGIDCSGLVQAALLACNQACPGDSDQQQQALGRDVPAGSTAQRGDLLFWPGHVALVADENTLLHANAFHMAVALEPLKPALARIAAQGDGDVTAHKRL